MRAQVLYVADAGVLTGGGTFARSEAEPGSFDTPEAAQLLLHNLLAAHEAQMGGLRTPDGSRSLAEVSTPALSQYYDAHAAAGVAVYWQPPLLHREDCSRPTLLAHQQQCMSV